MNIIIGFVSFILALYFIYSSVLAEDVVIKKVVRGILGLLWLILTFIICIIN